MKNCVTEYHSLGIYWSLQWKNIDRGTVLTRAKWIEKGSDLHITQLKEKIRATDNLIDQIVYKLYGLAAEEVEIVESGR